MSDIAFQQLRQALLAHQGQGIWVVDESINDQMIASVGAVAGLHAVTNRIDVYQQLQAAGLEASLNDFDLQALGGFYDRIYYRVSKEKPVVHHVINQAASLLPEGGHLLLAGYKNEGTKTYIDKAAKCLGVLIEKSLGGKTAMLADIERDEKTPTPLDDKNYRQTLTLTLAEGVDCVSKPGVYGWNKVDKGSAFLIEHLSAFMDTVSGDKRRFADIGCGFGYLSVMAAQQFAGFYSACDNNVAAVNCCEKNFASNNIDGEVRVDNCGESLPADFDVVLCNPPFHQGFDVESDLCGRFLKAAQRLLRASGAALFVVNAFIPIEKKAQAIFSRVDTIANNGSFKLVAVYR